METRYLELHNRYRLRCQASLYQGVNSAGYVANWVVMKALETSDPAKFIATALNDARVKAEGSESSPKLNEYWETQVRMLRQALAEVGKVEGR